MRYYYTIAFLSATMLTGTAAASQPVPVVSGGVGESGKAAIEERQEAYNLKLVYTGEKGMYLSDVNVVIRDEEGFEIVNGITQGPFLLAELPPGRYTVESSTEGYDRKQTVSLGKGLKTYHVRFPVKDESYKVSALSPHTE